MLFPPGLYGGAAVFGATTFDFVDGNGNEIPALRDAHLAKELVGPFLYYVPNVKVLGGSVGIGAMVPIGNLCGHLLVGETDRCTTGFGDPYAEIDWSRSFGHFRPSTFAGAYPIFEGLSILLGFGLVIPIGIFDASDVTEQAVSIGTNIWDLAPTIAVTYTTPPIIAEGTEVSAKLYWNNYRQNPDTNYLTGDVISMDFAVTERIGRFQVGAAGVYAVQIEDDTVFGAPVAPDGRRTRLFQFGGVVAYDMPEYSATLRLKANTSLLAENTPEFWSVVFGWIKKY